MANDSLLQSVSSFLRPEPRPIDKLLAPIQAFGRHRLAGAAMLMLATAVALVWANSPWEHTYHAILHTEFGFSWGDTSLTKDLHHWVNDGLMSIFFFTVGLEIKREVMVGELSTVRKATLPAIAAVGGMAVPALLYMAINGGTEAAHGWGIPMATDIAFALGVLALLGDRVPLGLKVFLTALAIVDDIGAVLVIAVFYTAHLSLVSLVFGFVFLAVGVAFNGLHVRSSLAYVVVGVLTWLAFLESGVHATIATLLLAFTIPARTRIDGRDLMNRLSILAERLERVGVPSHRQLNTPKQQHCLERMEQTLKDASAPLQRIEHGLSTPVAFIVLPVFALANAGVTIHGGLVDEVTSPIALGIILGLFVGKTVGITASAFLAVKLGVADLPTGVRWSQVLGVALLGGIGFTMALFIGELAFADPMRVETAKVGTLTASILSGLVGYFLVRGTSTGSPAAEGAGEPATA